MLHSWWLLVRIFFILLIVVVCRTEEVCQENQHGSCSAGKTVVVTGSNGFVGSWMVKELLAQGYTVHACVRDASQEAKVQHLLQLPGAEGRLELFSTGNLGQEAQVSVWDAPLRGANAVIHTSMAMNWHDGENGMYHPTVEGTRHLLQAIERHTDTIQSLILTSSMAAVDTQANGMTDESHWRSAEYDMQQNSWYSATKIAQEKLATQWAHDKIRDGTLPSNFQFFSICPTRVIAPPVHPSLPIEGWLNQLREWLKHPPSKENDTMELVHAQDVARLHIAALESEDANGRYLCVDESWHWNDLLEYLQQLHPDLPAYHPAGHDDDDKLLVPPRQYSRKRRNALGVPFRSMKAILQECVDYLKARGELGEFATI